MAINRCTKQASLHKKCEDIDLYGLECDVLRSSGVKSSAYQSGILVASYGNQLKVTLHSAMTVRLYVLGTRNERIESFACEVMSCELDLSVGTCDRLRCSMLLDYCTWQDRVIHLLNGL